MDKLRLRKAIYILFTFQVMLISYVSLNSPFIAHNFTKAIVIQALMCAVLGFYMFDLKNVKGWWKKQVFKAKQRMVLKKEVEREILRRNGLSDD